MTASLWAPGALASSGVVAPSRLVIRSSRYITGAVTATGAGNTINVTGYNKLLLNFAAATSVTLAWFDASESDGADTARNGELILEAMNGNATLVHTARGGAVNSLILSGGANLALVAGQVVRFLRSETNSQWQQV